MKTVDDKQLQCGKSEMTALLASEPSFRERLRRAGSAIEKKKEKRQLKAGKRATAKIGPESPQGKALQHLQDVYRGVIEKVSFQWKNPDFLSRNPDFLSRNSDFKLKNPDFITKTGQGWGHCCH